MSSKKKVKPEDTRLDVLAGDEKKVMPSAEKKEDLFKEDKSVKEEGEAQKITPDLLKEFKEMLSKQEQLIRAQGAEIEKLKSDKLSETDESNVGSSVIEDYMEEPAVFFAFSSYYGIHGDKRYGKTVFTPDGEPFRFEKAYRWQKKNSAGGRGTEVISVCQSVVRSAKRAQWLREHSLFNIKFFEKLDDAMRVDTFLAEKMAWANSIVTNMNDHGVIERAKVEGLPVDPDLKEMRRSLIEKLARNSMEADAARHRNRASGQKKIEERKITDDHISSIAKDTAAV